MAAVMPRDAHGRGRTGPRVRGDGRPPIGVVPVVRPAATDAARRSTSRPRSTGPGDPRDGDAR